MPVTIRSRLLLLVLAVLLPAVLGSGWLILTALQAERASHELRLRDTTRALSMVVDGELERRIGIARALAQSRWLDGGAEIPPKQLQGFENQARSSMVGLEGWLELRAPGRLLLDTRLPLATRPPAQDVAALDEAPSVQPLLMGGQPHAAIVQPVQRGGLVALNLVITVKPSELQRIIDTQQLPATWVGAILDDRRVVVARHPGGEAHVGRLATADLSRELAARNEGMFQATSLDGKSMVGYFSTSQRGWTYVGAIPKQQLVGGLSQMAQQLVPAALILLTLAVTGALWVSRRIAEPAQSLKRLANRMRSGHKMSHDATGVVEFDEVAGALVDAAQAIHRSRADLEHQVTEAVAQTRLAEQRASHSQRVEALGRLTGGVAHDFNNLLGVISNSLYLIERHANSPAQDSSIAAIRRSVETGSQLTQHLLRFAGRRPVQPTSLTLSSWLHELLALLSSVLGRSIEGSVRVEPDTAPVLVDAGELELALMNLALNARDAMPAGGKLQLSARNASPEESEGLPGAPLQRFVIITVSDDGVGMSPRLAERAFEPFFTTKPVGQGTGLGLSQVHGFCVQAGGATRLDSTPGLGTAVSLLLPAAVGLAQPLAVAAPPAPDVAGTRLLLVEDNDELAIVTAELLRQQGVIVQRADSAADALRLLAVQPFFDIVLSDVVMPGDMDGLDLAHRIRHDFPALQVILISGYNDDGASNSEFKLLRKPCPPEELLRAVHAARVAATPAQD